MRTPTIFLISFVILFSACKKSKNSPSASGMLAGKWKTSSKGYDVNKNSLIDPDENVAVSDSMLTVFDQQGTGLLLNTQNGVSDTLTWFTWALNDSSTSVTTIRTKGSASYISLSTTTTYHIDTLSATDLRLSIIAASSGLNWENYKKQ